MSNSTRILTRLAMSALGLLIPMTAFAVDGVFEINQVKAEAGGVSPGDTAGFPVHLNQEGSYRLTGDIRCGNRCARSRGGRLDLRRRVREWRSSGLEWMI